MSETSASLSRKIRSAEDLQSVVRTMKALAVSSVGQYEDAVRALADYHRGVELGLSVCFQRLSTGGPVNTTSEQASHRVPVSAIVFGSDQGLVGQFNEGVADYAIAHLRALRSAPDIVPLQLWAVGERVHARLVDAGLPVLGLFPVPTSVKGIAPLVGQLQLESDAHRARDERASLHVFFQRSQPGGTCVPSHRRLLPLDTAWRTEIEEVRWPTKHLPDILPSSHETLRALLREYLFIALYRSCAESLASENASRLSAMERADRNIDELLESMVATSHRLRQAAIDEELFDVVAGYEALGGAAATRRG